eukprot:TRINITY_DN994_c1_g1_i2.p1 TRINITY_DN994_c1_g1~~TRINITY_DN994_c1_g1_i2.p1  ORF type:complete len:450 (-),score=110.19 TRINITY_DN994_c1_g1_i2:1391-2740(-)
MDGMRMIRQISNRRQIAREIIFKSDRNSFKSNKNDFNVYSSRTKDASRVLQGLSLIFSSSLSNHSQRIPLSSFNPSKDPFQSSFPPFLDSSQQTKEKNIINESIKEESISFDGTINSPLSSNKNDNSHDNSNNDGYKMENSERVGKIKEEEWINVSEENLEMKNKMLSGRERKVPTSRMGRAWYFGTMAMGIGMGAVGESIKRSVGMSDSKYKSTIVSESNVRKLTDGLSRMRGAALKIGQMMSLQDDKLLPPELNAIIERVRNSADYMPASQLNKMVETELGENWKDKFQEFEMKPFAAASIGQVHKAVLTDGTKVAVKVQYPGIADSIDSDVNNLLSLLQLSGAVPKGAFIDRTIDVTKKELLVETDYHNEAKNQMQYFNLLSNDPDFVVPSIIPSLSTSKVMTSEFMPGIPVDSVASWDQSVRNWVNCCSLKASFINKLIIRCPFD